MFLFVGMSAKAETVTFDFTGAEAYGMTLLSGSTNEYNSDPYACTEGDVTMTLNGRSRWWKTSAANELRMYAESNFEIAVPDGKVITAINLTAKTPANFTAAVGTYADGKWTGAAQSVTISCTITKSNTPISKVEVVYQASSGPIKSDPALSFSETIVSATMGEAFTAPTLSKATDGAITYSSEDEAVATVDSQTGAVTLVGAGETVITATAAETETYSAGSASYTLKVSAPVMEVVQDPYYETFEMGAGSFVIENTSLPEGLTYVWNHDSNYKYMKASAYNKKNFASESWLVSPWIELSSAEVVRYAFFDHCINKYFGNVETEATVWIKEEGGEWKQQTITYPAIKENSNWSDFETQEISLAGYEGKKIKVGFKYVSTDQAAGTWEIKNFGVSATTPQGIESVEAGKATKQVIYNMAGQRMEKMQKGLNIVNGKKVIKRQ